MYKLTSLRLSPAFVPSTGLLLLFSWAGSCLGLDESTRLETMGREKRNTIIHGESFLGNISTRFVGCFVTEDGWALFPSDSICLSDSTPVFTLSNGDELPSPRITLIDTDREIVLAKFACKPATWCEINFEPLEIDTWVAIVDGTHQFPVAIGPVLASRPVVTDSRKDLVFMQELSIGSKLHLYREPFPAKGSPVIDKTGNLRGLYSGMNSAEFGQTIVLARPIDGWKDVYARTLESDETVEFPVDADSCPYDPVILDPDWTTANLMVMKNKVPEAELGRLGEKYPDSPNLLIFKHSLESSPEGIETAIRGYRNDPDLPPGFCAVLYSALGLKREQKGDTQGAIDAYGKALATVPEGQDPLQARNKLARVYLKLKDYENALKIALEASALYPDQIGVQMRLHHIYEALGASEKQNEVRATIERLASIYEVPLPSFGK